MYYSPESSGVAYLLYVFDPNTVHGAERLLHWLYTAKDTFVFHVDASSSDLYLCYLKTKYGESARISTASELGAALLHVNAVPSSSEMELF